MRKIFVFVFSLSLLLAVTWGFEASEHRFKADQAFAEILKKAERKGLKDGLSKGNWAIDSNGATVALLKLKGQKLSPGDITAAAGDFIAAWQNPTKIEDMTDSVATEEWKTNFLGAFNAQGSGENWINAIVALFPDEQKALESNQPIDGLLQKFFVLSRIVGGRVVPGDIKTIQKRDFLQNLQHENMMMKLASDNNNHFLSRQASVKTYKIGHAYSCKLAADSNGDFEKLRQALASEFMALHFLHDMFAAGHQRTPATQFRNFCQNLMTPTSSSKANQLSTGDTIAKAMHGEDNKLGLTAQNQMGDRFKTFGDGALWRHPSVPFLTRKSDLAKKASVAWGIGIDMATLTLMVSIEEVLKCFDSKSSSFNNNMALKYAPSSNPLSGSDKMPLFSSDFDAQLKKQRYYIRIPPNPDSPFKSFHALWQSECTKAADVALALDQGKAPEADALWAAWELASANVKGFYVVPTWLKEMVKNHPGEWINKHASGIIDTVGDLMDKKDEAEQAISSRFKKAKQALQGLLPG